VRPLRVANCSGFYGDRFSAATEMVNDGDIDVLTGDWLAELTMGLLAKQRARDPQAGYARTFLGQVEQTLRPCLQNGIRIISNAGGLNPNVCATQVRSMVAAMGLEAVVAVVDGDEVTAGVKKLLADGWTAPHLSTGEPYPDDADSLEVANVYLGTWGIVKALELGADIIITGRVTDAAVVVAAAAWRFGWGRGDFDQLAGAVAAGHVIECGAQATGGNYSFFDEFDGTLPYGFPIAEIHPDGSAVICKHPGTGGSITTETVLSQIVYEIDGPEYLTPDVVARFDTLTLEQLGLDRVRISGTKGQAPPETLKAGLIRVGGWRASLTLGLTGLNVDAKVKRALHLLWQSIPGGRDVFDDAVTRLHRGCEENPRSSDEAVSLLTVSVASRDKARVARFISGAVEIGLASYPGCFLTGPPPSPTEFMVFWPTLLDASEFSQRVTVRDVECRVPAAYDGPRYAPLPPAGAIPEESLTGATDTCVAPLGKIAGARSGDKAGNATLGVWVRNPAHYGWLAAWWTPQRVRSLIPEAQDLELRLWWLPNVAAVGCTIVGLLGGGAAASLSLDTQAKGLGEFVRARHAAIPRRLLEGRSTGELMTISIARNGRERTRNTT
jgi:Acyclic terpene utilisation family protein AtuA